ncbi:MAG: hypothetical protein PHC28_01410 [Flavobacterium sp.]|uniref:archaellin/type IV pilin N-terminal domain-containing protein n=1 Tax=Flavobacterium sp. TaxID=239 RepID=UPI00261AA18C|nr:archaellin/type IV pilin N-terminal domain-containing protein [Flavobacterium sp.]MDD5149125.1 hypothetical protein [Flavobacterium sp.]
MIKKKKGVSPMIATILLITLVILIAVIIYWWAKGFFGEELEKFGETAEQACNDVDISVSAFSDGIDIINNGNVPIVGVTIKKVSSGKSTTESFEFENGIIVGGTGSVETDISSYEKIIVIPAILVNSGSENKIYTCDEETGQEV